MLMRPLEVGFLVFTVLLSGVPLTLADCAPIQWETHSAGPGFTLVTQVTQLSCTAYRQQQYYLFPDSNSTGMFGIKYWNVGFSNSYDWVQNTYVDPAHDPLIGSSSRWTWSADQKSLVQDSISSRIDFPPEGSAGFDTSFGASTSVYTIFNSTTISVKVGYFSRKNAHDLIAQTSEYSLNRLLSAA